MKNLWGDIADLPKMKPPVALLREQASLLGDITKGLLVGEVKSTAEAGLLFHSLNIVAPALDGYRYKVLRIRHDVEMYPAFVESSLVGPDMLGMPGQISCVDETRLTQVLAELLASPQIKRVLAALLAQIQDQAVA